MPMKEEVGGEPETWRMGYLLDIVLTRDPWMHRVDIARATGRDSSSPPEHDGRSSPTSWPSGRAATASRSASR